MRLRLPRIDRLFPPFRCCGIPALAWLLLLGSCQDHPATDPDQPATGNTVRPFTLIGFTTTGLYPHDTTAFTEGLLFHEGELYESTGHVDEVPASRSWFGLVNLRTGRIDPKVQLPRDKYFGEGICFLHGKVYQLTYKDRVGFVYDAKTFKKLGEFSPPGREGWGMTTDGQSLLISDGTSTLYYMDPSTFQTVRTLKVTENDVPPDSLNELEYIKGYIYANRYTKDYIFKIDPANGKVLGRLDCSSLAGATKNKYPGSMELNGIAYDPVSDRIFITGKCWPDIYTIRLPNP